MNPSAFMLALGITLAIPAYIVGWWLSDVRDYQEDWPYIVCTLTLTVGAGLTLAGLIGMMWQGLAGWTP